ncbi:MAG: two-component sensor histidine kinase [Gammaproteobacteria bacterium]|nr:two-component sensor histidine kinase [Gammaproteobacteria bacterium]
MTIRKALLRAFLGLVLGSTLSMGALSFYEFRRSLQQEIAGNLQFGASTVLQRIDTFLFAQLENLRLWSRLEIMQDIRVDDVDKRLAHFLADLRAGQGSVFQTLLCTDTNGRVIASSAPLAYAAFAPEIDDWIKIPGNGPVELSLQTGHGRSADTVVLRTRIPDAFGQGDLGYLYALLNWREVLDLLDDAVAQHTRGAVLLDAAGRAIGMSAELRKRLDTSALDLHDWQSPRPGDTPFIRDGKALGYANVLVGSATSSGYQHFPGLGWRLFMVEPTQQAFQPIWRLLGTMFILLLLTLSVAAWISWRLARRIAQPLMGLTEFTRRFRKDEHSRPVAATTAISEVDELDQAFVEMLETLAQSREQIVRAGKLAVVGEMAAIMAHEVRTPLGILKSSAQLLERQPNLGDKERELIGFITSETDRLNRLVTLLLECARPRPPEFKARDVHEIVTTVVNLLAAKAEKKHVRLRTDLQAENPLLLCDGEQLTQVFLNLLINALDFVPEGGHIDIHSRDDGDALLVSVLDDGPGIAPELRAHIFDPFFSRREGGIGLGLTIVQQIVHVHHASIQIADSPWGGARFDIRFSHQPHSA